VRRLACGAVLVAMLAVGSSADARSTRAERIAAANAFADRTIDLDRKLRAARGRGHEALAARRRTARKCIVVWRSAPARVHDDLRILYGVYLNAAVWSVDAPRFGSWIADLRGSRRIDRSPVLARAADALRSDYRFADSLYRAFPDACATITTWRGGAWRDSARPAGFAPIDRVMREGLPRDDELVDSAIRQLRRYARSGDRAAHILSFGVDVPDYRNRLTTMCDPVEELLFPDENGCASHRSPAHTTQAVKA